MSHYEILERIGEGGMGVVYKARDTRLNRFVALKFLPRQLLSDETARQRFRHEAEAVSRLDHANICTLFDIDQTPEGQLFMAMGFYEGETLQERIRRGPITFEEALRIAISVGEGLTAAHEQGVIHRDIKPANVALTRDGSVKLLDFGLARLKGTLRLTETGTTAGTAAYMSPEQVSNEELTESSDIWSLGVLLFEMLTGRLPFGGEYQPAIMYAILHEPVPDLPETSANIPDGFAYVLRRAMEKAATNRYQSARAFVDDLRRFLSSPGPARSLPRSRSSRVSGIATTAIAAGLLGVASFVVYESLSVTHDNIVVLPFERISTGGLASRDEFMMDETITLLSRETGLSVLSRNSSLRLQPRNEEFTALVADMNVRFILEGVVRESEDFVRVSAVLTEAATDRCVWAQSYILDPSATIDYRPTVAAAIVSEVRSKLTTTTSSDEME